MRFGRFYRYFIIRYISKASRILCDADELLQCDRTSKPVTCSYNPQGRNTRAFMRPMQKCLVTKHSQGFHISVRVGNRNSWIVHINKFNSIIQMGNEQHTEIHFLWLSLVVMLDSTLLICSVIFLSTKVRLTHL